MNEALLTYSDLEELFRVSRRTIFNWVRSGELPPALEIGRKRLWRASQIEEVLRRREIGSSEAEVR